jgi:DNA-binding MarR family transcriptional regulator
MTEQQVLEILRAYPQIYLACHVEHRTRGKSSTGLTSRDASFLAHVEDPAGSSPAQLARHLGISPSTLSAALARMEAQGLVSRDPNPGDARRRMVRLTPTGRSALAANSVLDPERVAALLARLGAAERDQAVAGLQLLAKAARTYREEES